VIPLRRSPAFFKAMGSLVNLIGLTLILTSLFGLWMQSPPHLTGGPITLVLGIVCTIGSLILKARGRTLHTRLYTRQDDEHS